MVSPAAGLRHLWMVRWIVLELAHRQIRNWDAPVACRVATATLGKDTLVLVVPSRAVGTEDGNRAVRREPALKTPPAAARDRRQPWQHYDDGRWITLAPATGA